MNLDLPSRVPLPDDVRQRALDTVLDGLDAPAPRRFRPELVAAAVVVALLVSLTVALSGGGRPDPPLVAAAPAGPSDEVDIRSTEGMVARCAAVLDGVPGYPDPAQWRVGLQRQSSDGESMIVIDDAFVCAFTPTTVTVSAMPGTPVGDARLVSIGPDEMALLNPLRRTIVTDPPVNIGVEPDEALQFLPAPGPGVPGLDVTVGDSFRGPLPEPAAPAVTVQDRTLPMRPAYGSPEATADDNDLDSCANTVAGSVDRNLWTPVLRVDDGPIPLLLARIADQYVGVCALAADGPRFMVAPMPVWEGSAVEPGDPGPSTTLTFTIGFDGSVYGFDQNSPFAAVDPCVDASGIAVCGNPPTVLTVRLATPSEDLTVPRAPGR